MYVFDDAVKEYLRHIKWAIKERNDWLANELWLGMREYQNNVAIETKQLVAV